ncbi:MAG: hypothetical protein QNJ16_05980 [Rhodobacter sp.]|nr:hypothetical protein [Rhodobacter sp.]
MSLVRRLGKTRFGKWLRGLAKAPGVGPLVRAAARRAKRAEQDLVRRMPDHRAHDRAQAATLAAFERATADRDAAQGAETGAQR